MEHQLNAGGWSELIRRRELLMVLGGAALAWPAVARATEAMPVLGYLSSGPAVPPFTDFLSAFKKGLEEGGYREGKNLAIEYRWAENRASRLPALAADLVARRVDVIAATGGSDTAKVAKGTTQTIPIVFVTGYDPVDAGLVPSLARPGGNITGATFFSTTLIAKIIELLHDMIPGLASLGLLTGAPGIPETMLARPIAETAAKKLGIALTTVALASDADIDPAFAAFAAHHVGGVVFSAAPIFNTIGPHVIAAAARYAMPLAGTSPQSGQLARNGGLVGYGTSIFDAYRQAALYAAKILGGAKPADLPVMQPTKFFLEVNLKTAKRLGITVPQTILATADEVIE